jgi:hypothetical protein
MPASASVPALSLRSPRGMEWRRPIPIPPSRSTMSRSRRSARWENASSSTRSSAPKRSLASLPAAARSAPMITGTPGSLAAIRHGSSPPRRGSRRIRSPSLTTAVWPSHSPPYPLLITAVLKPDARASPARWMHIGVLPVPPRVMLPTETTLRSRRALFKTPAAYSLLLEAMSAA